MNVSDQRVLCMRHVSHPCIRRKQAGRRGIGIGSVTWQKEILGEVEQAEMPPVAGVKLLSMEQEIGVRRSRVGPGAEVRNIRNSLFFVDHQVFDNLQVLSRRLRYQMFGRVAICATVIHVHVNVAADPVRARLLRKAEWLQMNRQTRFLSRGYGHRLPLETVFKALYDL